MKRKDFISQAGMLLGGATLMSGPSGETLLQQKPATAFDPMDWLSVQDQFSLSRSYIHMALFLLASHPRPVAEAIERHRQAFDKDPVSYWHDHYSTAEPNQRVAAAEYLGANPDHIALTDSTTMGLGLVYGTLNLAPGQEILSTTHDHYSTEMSLRHRSERTGSTFRQIDLYDDPATASVDEIVSRMLDAITDRTRVLAVTWVHSSTGVKLPLVEMSQALREVNASRDKDDKVLLCVDAVHGLGIEDITMDELGCDFFIAGTHKWLFGPRGTGIIWGRPDAWEALDPVIPSFGPSASVQIGMLPPDTPLITPGNYFTPGGFHSFEHRWALSEAFRFHLDIGKARVQERIHSLNTLAKEALSEMPHVRLYTPMSPALSAGITCFDVAGYMAEEVIAHLREQKIIAAASPYREPYPRLAPGVINTEKEVQRSVAAIRELG